MTNAEIICNEAIASGIYTQEEIEELLSEGLIVVNGRFCPQSVRNFCPIVAGFNASTYKVPACVL